MASYRVAEGTQVHLDGTTYGSGEKLPTLEAETAAHYLQAGWVEQVDAPAADTKPAPKKATATKAAKKA